jgi:hypothetical protein
LLLLVADALDVAVADPVALDIVADIGMVILVWYSGHDALAARGQSSPVQIDWSWAPWAGMTIVGGAHLTLKMEPRALPTMVRSDLATPKEAAHAASSTFTGVVVAKEAKRGTLVVAARSGAARTHRNGRSGARRSGGRARRRPDVMRNVAGSVKKASRSHGRFTTIVPNR